MLVTHGRIVTMGTPAEIIPDGALYIEGERIADIGPSPDLEARYPTVGRLDARYRLVMPGLVNAHTHFYQAFARGMTLPGEIAANSSEILERVWWRLDRALWADDIHSSALVSLVDAIRHGTTTLIDHHASQSCIPGSLDLIASAVEQAGVRACLCYEVSDRDGDEATRAAIRENARFIGVGKGRQDRGERRIAATFGLHASMTLSEETLRACAELAGQLETGCHLHVAEDKADVRETLRRSGLRVVERLERIGVLGPSMLAAHCVHVDRLETDLLRHSGSMVVHCPRSNMANAAGSADLRWMLKIGIPVGLGTDGFSSNMFAEMAAAYLLHKQASNDPCVIPAEQVVRMGWDHNARIARSYFPELGPAFGRLAVGAPADLILVDYDPPTPLTAENLPQHVVSALDGTNVDTTIVAGRPLMRDGVLLGLDEKRTMARARDLASRLWERM